jgi:parallel beta helix pectate lyase-like protein
MARTPAFAVLALLLLPAVAAGITRQVPAQYGTIQAALDVSTFGDVIQVAPGTYHEHLSIQQAGVAIMGAGADVTTIHGSGTGRVIEFFAVIATTKLSGFRITGGVAATGGGGIRCVLASPQILDCIIEGNTAPEGGGVFLSQSRPQIKGCTIRDNVATGSPFEQHDGGGLLLVNNSPALIENCQIQENTATSRGAGIRMRDAGAAIVRGCGIRGNAAGDIGGGVAVSSSAAGPLLEANVIDANTAWGGGAGVMVDGPGTITQCTIASNTAENGVGGVVFHGPGTITRCTIAFNTGTLSASGLVCGEGVAVDHTIVARNFNAPGVSGLPDPDPAFACNDVWGHQFGDYHAANPTGTNGNISENPLFCNPGFGDLGLATGSPCSAALNACGLVGALDVTCAVTESRRSSWGQLKARYR